jgi:Uma2 family endonuclease
MSLWIPRPARPEVVYPDSDGQPMAENTLQYQWITTIVGGLEAAFRHDPKVFVAGDLFWYPVEGDPNTRTAPDAMVVLGRPKGHRLSYRQWEEDGLAPQVVFEVLPHGNRPGEMTRRFQFYERFGVEEYYLFDPEPVLLDGWQRDGNRLRVLPALDGWVSPRLGTRFDLSGGTLTIYGPDHRPFATYLELAQQRDALAQQRNEVTQQRDAERQRAERLAAKLRELGIEPDA